jgi:hypothetical protein
MMISSKINDDVSSDEDQYSRVQGRNRQGQDYRQGYQQDYRQGQDSPRHQDDEALELVSTNDWWRLLLPNPWMEVHRL